ncbi:MAG TPA: porin [Thermoanaerobaculales bacterium]|nr:porin [Thermoanaerobaculales bacterium]
MQTTLLADVTAQRPVALIQHSRQGSLRRTPAVVGAGGDLVFALAAAALLVLAVPPARSGEPTDDQAPPSLEETLEAGESSVESPRRQLVSWNEFDGPFTTLRFGGGLLYEIAGFSQDDESQQQFDLSTEDKVRDFRFLFKGRLKTERPVTWTCGVMYDGPSDSWLVRETGVMVAVPELWGHLFIGRTKEGFSLNKVMTGYSGWTLERATIIDATIPILADGIKWLGYVPERGLLWNVGWYGDWLSEDESFSSYDHQFVARVAWLPIVSETEGRLLHLGVNFRQGEPDDGQLQVRSRPEAFPAPYFVDTGRFEADASQITALEAYYRSGPYLLGSEYFYEAVDSPATGDPAFHGGDVVFTWLITGETRAYNTLGGYFKSVSPARTVFEGGPGAWELVARVSYIDLDGGTLRGGTFWRFTPMVNWYLSDNIRFELAYGYGTLDRFGLEGTTQFFQSRIQLLF